MCNLQRGADDPVTEPADLMPLPGDDDFADRTAAPVILTPAEKLAQQQRILERTYSTPLTL